MRHFGSLLLAAVFAPSIFLLTGTGLSAFHSALDDNKVYDPLGSLAALGALLLAGVLYAILVMARLSPFGPGLAGLAYMGTSIWALLDIEAYQEFFSHLRVHMGGAVGETGLGILLGVPLVATIFTGRWRRRRGPYAPPQLITAPEPAWVLPTPPVPDVTLPDIPPPSLRYPAASAFPAPSPAPSSWRTPPYIPPVADPEAFGTIPPPDSAQPVSAQPASAQPASAPPVSAQPASAQPASGQPGAAPPVAAQPDSAQPDSAQPVSAQPASAQPASAQPASAQPVSAQPASRPISAPPDSRPVSAQPFSAQPFSAPPLSAAPASRSVAAEPGLAPPVRHLAGPPELAQLDSATLDEISQALRPVSGPPANITLASPGDTPPLPRRVPAAPAGPAGRAGLTAPIVSPPPPPDNEETERLGPPGSMAPRSKPAATES